MIKFPDQGTVSPHSASATGSPQSPRARTLNDSDAGLSPIVTPNRDRKYVSTVKMDCRKMTHAEIQALIDEPDKWVGEFNFEGNKNLTHDQFNQIIGRGSPVIFPNLKFAKLNIQGTNLEESLIKASKKWGLMEQLAPIFMPNAQIGLLVDYPTEIDIAGDDEIAAFMEALKAHPAEAKLIEILDLEGADLTNAQFAEIVGYLENVTDLDVPSSVTEIPDLKGLVHLKKLGINEQITAIKVPSGCTIHY